MRFSSILTAAIAATFVSSINANAATIDFTTTNDFFTTTWAFGAPYLRGQNETTRASIGVSTPNPYTFGNATTNSAEETSYFQFAFDPSQFTGPVSNAVLRANMVTRTNSEPAITTESPIYISAHRVTADPLTTIDPATSASFIAFKNNNVTTVEDTVGVGGAGTFEWDVTDLVNAWIASGEANFDYTIAMTARVGNPLDTANSGMFHAFVNREANPSQAATLLVTVPEPTTLAALASVGTLIARRRR